jgi:hypothetical protein
MVISWIGCLINQSPYEGAKTPLLLLCFFKGAAKVAIRKKPRRVWQKMRREGRDFVGGMRNRGFFKPVVSTFKGCKRIRRPLFSKKI